MGWIFVDKESGEGEMRSSMRHSMRGGYRKVGSHVGDDYERGYRYGYKHGWEDCEDEDAEYRRGRDSKGRYI